MQREALEGANTNTSVLTNMKGAADALKAAHQHMYEFQCSSNMHTRTHVWYIVSTLITFPFLFCSSLWLNRDVDQVHDMMDDIAEQQDVAKEISEAISNPVAFGNLYDTTCYQIVTWCPYWLPLTKFNFHAFQAKTTMKTNWNKSSRHLNKRNWIKICWALVQVQTSYQKCQLAILKNQHPLQKKRKRKKVSGRLNAQIEFKIIWLLGGQSLSFQFVSFYLLFAVVAKPAEDDDDMKLLMSWAN